MGEATSWLVNKPIGKPSAILTFLTLIAIAGVIYLSSYVASEWRRKEEEQQRRQDEEKRRQEEQQRRQDEEKRLQVAARAQSIARIASLVSDAQLAAASLPVILSAAESSLDTAQSEYDEGLYSPFWEAMEKAVQYMSSFERLLQQIVFTHEKYQEKQGGFNFEDQQQYGGSGSSLARELVPFSLGVKVLPDLAPTKERMKRLYRLAQKNADFANIYEHRRNTAAIIEGFRSLGDAVTSLGDRIETEVRYLGDTFEFRLADLGTAMREAGEQMQRQQESLLAEARSWREEARGGHAELVSVARENAERAERGAQERREMLDNIQRRRKPSILGF